MNSTKRPSNAAITELDRLESEARGLDAKAEGFVIVGESLLAAKTAKEAERKRATIESFKKLEGF